MSRFRLIKRLMGVALIAFPYAGCQPSPQNLSHGGQPEGLLPKVSAAAVKAEESSQPLVLESGGKAWVEGAELPLEAWYSLYLNQNCVGVSYLAVKPPEIQGSNLLRLVNRDIIEVHSEAGHSQRSERYVESLERPSGQLLSFTETLSTDEATTETNADVRAEVLTLTTTVEGKAVTTNLPVPTGAWGPLGTLALLRQVAKLPEQPYQAQFFARQLNKFVKVNLIRSQPELITLPGGVVEELSPVEMVLSNGELEVRSKNWISPAGELVKSVGQSGFTMFQITQSAAELIEAEIKVSALLQATVPIDKPITAFDAPSITYKITAANRDPFTIFTSLVNQPVTSINARNAEVVVTAFNPLHLSPDDNLQAAPGIDCSQASTWIPFQAPAIQSLANELLGATTEPLEPATTLTLGVHQRLEQKILSRQFARPDQTVAAKAGDCTAHATLLVSLLRARGVPARVASGLNIVAAGQESQGVFHMWCEAWVGDRWLTLDPFWGTVGRQADHLKLLESPLGGENPYDAVLPVLQVIPQLTISL